MKSEFKKFMTYALVFAMCMTMFTGCGKSSSDESSDSGYTKSFEGMSDNDWGIDTSKYVTLGEYKGLESYEVECSLTDEELEDEIDSAMYDYAEYTDITDRGAQDGDYIDFDYTCTIGSEAIGDCSDTDMEIQLGDEEFYGDLETNLLNRQPGDIFNVTTEVPEDMSEDYAGQEATFTFTVNTLQAENIPELTDDFCKENTDYDTVEEFKQSIEDEAIQTKQDDYEYDILSDLITKVVDSSTFTDETCEDLYDIVKTAFDSDLASQAEMFGLDEETYKSYAYGTDEDYEQAINDEVKNRLVMLAIANKESLYYNDDEYASYEANMASEYGYDSVEDLEADYGSDAIYYESIYENVTEFLLGNAKTEKISEDEFKKIFGYDDEETDDSDDSEDVESEEDDSEDLDSEDVTEVDATLE